ncbi:hypothetical protein EJ06DRAFT_519613 [Trichodelitschia bisporula]|uniref:Uncharacterized protein n=1 Tax=Trichodelitschia bisporula TaxID=703511 RepID=A0A6G1I6P1_9PEZI|nr:hypothetical protein EJ06DRAFT_519613 [Trichodelitschia bisporula]
MFNPAPTVTTTTIPPLNPTPIELDGSPITTTRPSKPTHLPLPTDSAPQPTVSTPGAEEEAWGALSGEKGAVEERREKRIELLNARARDPAVLVDIPATPGPLDYAVAERVDGAVGRRAGVEGAGAEVADGEEGGVPLEPGAR